MIDLRLVREDPDIVRASQRARGDDPAAVDRLLAADASRRASVSAADELRAEQKELGRSVGKASPEDRPALLARAKELAARVKEAESLEAEANEALTAAQGVELRAPLQTSPELQRAVATIRRRVATLQDDRYLAGDLTIATELVASGELAAAVSAGILPDLTIP